MLQRAKGAVIMDPSTDNIVKGIIQPSAEPYMAPKPVFSVPKPRLKTIDKVNRIIEPSAEPYKAPKPVYSAPKPRLKTIDKVDRIIEPEAKPYKAPKPVYSVPDVPNVLKTRIIEPTVEQYKAPKPVYSLPKPRLKTIDKVNRFIFNDDTTGVPPIEQESRRIFNGTDVKTVLNRTTFFVSVPLVILLAFSGLDVYNALIKISDVNNLEQRIIQGTKIGNLMAEILREQTVSYKYVLDNSAEETLLILRDQQSTTDKRVHDLYDTGFPKYLTTLNPQEYFIYIASADNDALENQDNMQMLKATIDLLQKKEDVLRHLNDVRIPPIKEKSLYENSFYSTIMGVFVQATVYTFSEQPEWFGDNWKMLVAFKSLLEVQRRAAAIDAILMFFYTKGYMDSVRMDLMLANEAVEQYSFSKIVMYLPDLKSDTNRLTSTVEMLRGHRYKIATNQSREVARQMGIDWINVANLYNEQLITVEAVVIRAMLQNIQTKRNTVNITIGITIAALGIIAVVLPFILQANVRVIVIVTPCQAPSPQESIQAAIGLLGKTYSMIKEQCSNTAQLMHITEKLTTEKERSDALIYKLVPKDIANKLKNHIPLVPEIFDSVSVLHADIVGFTKLSSAHSAIEIVSLLNYLFSLIDNLTDKYKAFKSETTGDSYTAVTGLPGCGAVSTCDAVTNIAYLALEMLGKLRIVEHENANMCKVKLRIGVATGPVSVGMIGMKIPRYCVFGETVTTARAMEGLSFPMKILITKNTRNFLADTGVFEMLFRGMFEIEDSFVETHWLLYSTNLPKEFDTTNEEIFIKEID